jgi:hypothetical protein
VGSLGIMSITLEQEQLVIGTLLGDGYLYSNGRLQIEHQEKFKSYVVWKHKMLQSVISGIPKRCVRFDKRTNKEYVSWRFYSKTVFQNYRNCFYPDGKKVVPENIVQLLVSPLALAVWFMDDGGRGAKTRKGLVISATGFSLTERILLKECLEKNFRLSVNIHKNGQFYIPALFYERFYMLVTPYIIPSMRYKIPITP